MGCFKFLKIMICLNSKGLPLLEELKNIRAETHFSVDFSKSLCCDNNMDKTLKAIKERKQNSLDDLLEEIREFNPEAILADGFESCILGYSSQGYVIYSINQIIDTLMDRDGMTEDEAKDFFTNIECAFVGEYTPYLYV